MGWYFPVTLHSVVHAADRRGETMTVRKAQAPYNKINKNSVITESENCTIIGWVLVALDAKVGQNAPEKPTVLLTFA